LRKERKMGRRQSGRYGAISSVCGKIQKMPGKPKNEIPRNVSQKFSKIINIIKTFSVKSVFRNSMPRSK